MPLLSPIGYSVTTRSLSPCPARFGQSITLQALIPPLTDIDTDKFKPNELTTAIISGIAHARARFVDTLRPTRDFTVVASKLAFQVRPIELG